MSYYDIIELRLRALFTAVADGREPIEDAVSFVKDEIAASLGRGCLVRQAGERTTTRHKASRRKLHTQE